MGKYSIKATSRSRKKGSLVTAVGPTIHKIHATRKEKPDIDYEFFTLLMDKGNTPGQIQEAYKLPDSLTSSWEIQYYSRARTKHPIKATRH